MEKLTTITFHSETLSHAASAMGSLVLIIFYLGLAITFTSIFTYFTLSLATLVRVQYAKLKGASPCTPDKPA